MELVPDLIATLILPAPRRPYPGKRVYLDAELLPRVDSRLMSASRDATIATRLRRTSADLRQRSAAGSVDASSQSSKREDAPAVERQIDDPPLIDNLASEDVSVSIAGAAASFELANVSSALQKFANQPQPSTPISSLTSDGRTASGDAL